MSETKLSNAQERAIGKMLDALSKCSSDKERREVILQSMDMIDNYDTFVDNVWFYDPTKHGNMPELGYASLKLCGESGEIAEKVGKCYRDSDGKIADPVDLLKELGDVLFYIVKLAHMHDYTLEDIQSMNMKKLNDRQARGKLHGSGDNR